MITPAQREAVARTLYDRDQEGGGNWGAFKSHWPEMLARYLADADEIIAAYEAAAPCCKVCADMGWIVQADGLHQECPAHCAARMAG